MNFNAVLSSARFLPSIPAGRFRRVRRSRASILPRCGLLLLPMTLVSGCGGGANSAASSTRQTGRLQVVVNWPAYQPSVGVGSSAASKQAGASGGRLIPVNATHIDIAVQDSQGGQQMFSVTRQNPAHTFVLPTGDTMVFVTEYDGNSPVTLQAQLKKTIQADMDTKFSITPQTNIVQIKSFSNQPGLVVGGSNGSVTAAAYSDAAGTSVVPVADGAFTFTPSGSDAVNVTTLHNVATLVPVHAGDVTITALLTLSTNSSDPTFSITGLVHVVPGITLSPTSATTPVYSPPNPPPQINFAVQLQGDAAGSAGGVTWSADGGTITQVLSDPSTGRYGGLYTPPTARGTFHVRVSSKFDSTQHADATIQVLGGNASINVN